VIAIVTDSGCDLPVDLLDERRVTVVPLTIRFGEDEFIDRETLDADAFWSRLLSDAPHPSTAAPSVGRFIETFESLADDGADGIVVMNMSSSISATHRSAELAKEAFTRVPVDVIDTRLVSASLGLAVLEAAGAALDGASFEAVSSIARDASASCRLFAALDTLEYLRRGGRIGRAQAFFGNLLDVKPLISFEGGEVTAAGRVRTRRKAVEAIRERLGEISGSAVTVGILHSDPPGLDVFVDEVRAAVGAEIVVARLGPVVGTHAGPGALGIVYRES